MSINLFPKAPAVTILGRAWIYEHDPPEIEVWEHEFEPMDLKSRSGADWAREHFGDYSPQDLREMFKLPPEGDWQVMFRGTLDGGMSGWESPEWDEWFDLIESSHQALPEEYRKARNNVLH